MRGGRIIAAGDPAVVIERNDSVRSVAASLRAQDAVHRVVFESVLTSNRVGGQKALDECGTSNTLLARSKEFAIAVSKSHPASVSEVIARRGRANFFRCDCPPGMGF